VALIQSEKLSQIAEWLDERAAIKAIWQLLVKFSIPGGARWVYVLGSGLLFTLALQFFTGILLLLYYVPSADYAHVSVSYIQKEVLFGNFIRGIHHYGSSVIVVLTVLHFLRTFFWGAYKNKRELAWIAGVILLLLILGFAFTGYLLPWDQKAYFGTGVGVSLIGAIPVLVETISQITLGGNELSTLTLSRFFVIHVTVLPVTLLIISFLHILLIRKAKPAGTFKETITVEEDYYPKQFFKDCFFTFFLFLLLATLSYVIPAPLEPQANPADANYIPRPEWYFLFLFQLLKYFQGTSVLIPAIIIPGLVSTVIFLLPFIDKKAERNPFKRPIASSIALVFFLGIISLASLAVLEDRSNPVIKAQLERQTEEGKQYLKTPFKPKNTGGAVAKPEVAPVPAVYQAKCASCHGDKAQGQFGPKLYNLSQKEKRSREDIIKLLENPQSYGLKPTMPTFADLSEKERQDLADWITSLKE
jgi:ubiquinol-cytochrome c reductase cytochrome b subunit